MSEELDPRAAGSKRLRDKVCIVTGSGQGIGRATAKRLGEEGGKIVVAERVDESATRTVTELKDHGVEAIKVLVDVCTFAGAKSLMAETVKAFGRIDVLVNNVGGTILWQLFHQYTEEQINRELERNLYPTLWCCLAVLPVMMEQKSGSIVNLSSGVTRGGLYRTPYAIGKGGVVALTKALAREYGCYIIRVNAVSPGGTKIPDRITPRLSIRPGVMATEENRVEAESYRREVIDDKNQLAIKRAGLPEEQASTIAFLASDDASFITGQVIDCRGEP